MLALFWDSKGTLYKEYFQYKKGKGVIQHCYFDTLLHLHDTIKQKQLGFLSREYDSTQCGPWE